MPSIGPMEVAIVLIVALLILGPKKLPSAGRSLGEGLRGFKESLSGKGSAEDETSATKLQQADVAPEPTEPAEREGGELAAER